MKKLAFALVALSFTLPSGMALAVAKTYLGTHLRLLVKACQALGDDAGMREAERGLEDL